MKTIDEILEGCEHDGSYIPVAEVKRLMEEYAAMIFSEKVDETYQASQSPEPNTVTDGEGWISVEDALPPLAPRSECVNELPFSVTVKVKDWGVLEYEAMYDYEHREWLQMPYENIIAERIVKWKPLPDPPTVETKKD